MDTVGILIRTKRRISRENAADILETVMRIVPECTPEQYFYCEGRRFRNRQFDPERVDELVRDWDVSSNPFMEMRRKRTTGWRITISLEQPGPDNTVAVSLPVSYVEEHPEVEGRLWELGLEICKIIIPKIGYCHHRDDLHQATNDYVFGQIYYIPATVAWASFWGSEVVEKIGLERIESFPWERKVRLECGGYALMLSPHLLDYNEPEVREKRERAIKHLRLRELYGELEREVALIHKARGEKTTSLVFRVGAGRSGELEISPPVLTGVEKQMESVGNQTREVPVEQRAGSSGESRPASVKVRRIAARSIGLLMGGDNPITPEMALKILKTIMRIAPECIPERYTYQQRGHLLVKTFEAGRVDEIMREWDTDDNGFLEMGRWGTMDWDIWMHLDRPDYGDVALYVPIPYVRQHRDVEMKLWDIGLEMYRIVRPNAGYCRPGNSNEDHMSAILYDEVRWFPWAVGWLTFVGPKAARVIGEEKIESFPWEDKVRMDDGGYVLKLCASPLDLEEPAVLKKRDKAVKHLKLRSLRRRRKDIVSDKEWEEAGLWVMETEDIGGRCDP